MKRSTMILVIQEALNGLYSPNNYYNDLAAKVLLKTIEDEGMLPPVCTVTVKDGKHTPSERVWNEEV